MVGISIGDSVRESGGEWYVGGGGVEDSGIAGYREGRGIIDRGIYAGWLNRLQLAGYWIDRKERRSSDCAEWDLSSARAVLPVLSVAVSIQQGIARISSIPSPRPRWVFRSRSRKKQRNFTAGALFGGFRMLVAVQSWQDQVSRQVFGLRGLREDERFPALGR